VVDLGVGAQLRRQTSNAQRPTFTGETKTTLSTRTDVRDLTKPARSRG
jgi:acyl dehydratase